MTHPWSWSESKTLSLQFLLLIVFHCFIIGVILWIVRLLWLSWQLKDVFSASIGISFVALPLFLALLAVFDYVLWGILLNRKGKG
jgi:hypothetical protein